MPKLIKTTLMTVLIALLPSVSPANDQPQWGRFHNRNMVSPETGLPSTFDPATGKNIRWIIPLGSETYSTPVIAEGKVLIGTNNQKPRDPRHHGDRGVLLCLNAADGSLCWQLVVPKLEDDIYRDWPRAGICSSAVIEGDRVYIVTNRAEVMCLDIKGLADGNDGPYRDEGRHMTVRGKPLMQPGELDADIIWLFDMRSQAGMYPHDAAHSDILLDGRYLYLNTGNGVDNTHLRIRAPNAPSLIVLDKNTGTLVARDNEHIGPDIFHATWSSPSMGKVKGKKLVFFAGGNGVCYAFDTLAQDARPAGVINLNRVWRFDFDPTAPKDNIHQYLRNRKVSPSTIMGMPVFDQGRVYVAGGGDIWWGKHQAWLKCIDATQTGEITQKGLLWSYTLGRHTCSTPAIYNGMVFIADCDGIIHCLDAKTGKAYWTHKARGDFWSSPLVADGKVYIGSRRKEFLILAAQRQKQLISSLTLDSPICSSAVAANHTLYIATLRKLYAISQGN